MVEIVNEMNSKGVRSSRGGRITIDILTRMLHNRRYIGEYRYRDIVYQNAIPTIIPQDLFEKVQDRMAQNKKAPAKHKATDDYILSPKLFCGNCDCSMVGETGTSKTSKKYHYYKCSGVKKHSGCHKKTVQKDRIEDIVLKQVQTILNDDELLSKIADEVLKEQEKENITLPLLKKQYAEILKSIDNMLNAIQSGIITSSTKERLEELEQQKIELTVQISQEEMERPMLTKEQIIDWLKSLNKYGIKRLEHKRKLINIFVNSVYLYDDKIIINFNYKDGSKAVRTDEVKKFVSSSDLHVLGGPYRVFIIDLNVGNGHSIFFLPNLIICEFRSEVF